MTTATFLGGSATPRVIDHDGKTYHVRRLDQTGMERFSAWLEEWVRGKLVTIYGHDEKALTAKLADLERDVLSGVYEFTEELVMGQEVWVPHTRILKDETTGEEREMKGEIRNVKGGVLHTHRGRVQLTAIVCGCTRDEALALIMARPEEMGHLLNLTLKESFPRQPDSWRPVGNESPAQAAH